MLNIIWPAFIIISYTYGILTGSLKEINDEIFNSVNNAVELSISLLRNNVLVEWINENSTI